nr:MAG TPA: hypothetical protein [Crassvirales sp.]
MFFTHFTTNLKVNNKIKLNTKRLCVLQLKP